MDLNPALRAQYLAAGTYNLVVPENKPPGFQEPFNQGHQKWIQRRKERISIVPPGENLSGIAEQFRRPLAATPFWNRIDLNDTLQKEEGHWLCICLPPNWAAWLLDMVFVSYLRIGFNVSAFPP